ncbi:MAG: hypothetical protein KGI02_05465 [Thaumarchaeota archaeon]|nr:hypothetical protein [Nitrososphaerota archaeon]MDE1877459.1 hypothetical protein [Nitrososphaerota archaeon]
MKSKLLGLFLTFALFPAGMMIMHADAQTSSSLIPNDHLMVQSPTSKSNLNSASEKAITGYVDTYLTNQGNHNWGMDQNVKNVIIDHNFDVVANMRYAGIYAFMFDVQNQKQHNAYNPTIQEAKLYGYFVKQYPTPVMPTNVTPDMITQVVQSWKDAANYGNVPYGLFLEEPSFWATTAGNAYCLHYNKCTLEEAKRGFDWHLLQVTTRQTLA